MPADGVGLADPLTLMECERDRYREALERIAAMPSGNHRGRERRIAREALERRPQPLTVKVPVNMRKESHARLEQGRR